MTAMDAVSSSVQYVSDEAGNPVGVIVPIALWREMESECETSGLLSNPVMRKRLLEAANRTDSVPEEAVRAILGF